MPNFTANGNLQMIRFFQVRNLLFGPVWGTISIFSITQKILMKLRIMMMNFLHTLSLTPQNPPKQVMLQFNDGNWEHRAYWGESLIPYGREGTVTKVKMGPLPELGKWIRLSVKAKKVGLETNAKVNGIAFTQWDGTVYWDKIGVLSKTDPRQDPKLSSKKWISIAKNDKSLPGNIQNLSKKSEKDRKDNEKEILKFHFS